MSRLNYMDFLPHELLFNIFILLSVKSLCNCKCVSKFWNFMISDPNFIKTHLTKTSFNNNLTLISTKHDRHSLYSVKFGNNCDGFARKFYNNSSKKCSLIWGSCNGLILVQDTEKVMFLINPTTLESYVLPPECCKLCLESVRYSFGFGYDCSCDDYVVVAIFNNYNDVYIYTLKTNKWTKVEARVWTSDYRTKAMSLGVFVEGSIHWLAYSNIDTAYSEVITAFNLANKEFSPILLPKEVKGLRYKFLNLVVLMGCLCATIGTELWVMKEYGVVESWTKFSITLKDVSCVVPLHLRENSLVLYEGGKFVLFCNDGNEVTMQYMDVLGLPSEFQLGMTFVESLVSPNYNKNSTKRSSNIGRLEAGDQA